MINEIYKWIKESYWNDLPYELQNETILNKFCSYLVIKCNEEYTAYDTKYDLYGRSNTVQRFRDKFIEKIIWDKKIMLLYLNVFMVTVYVPPNQED